MHTETGTGRGMMVDGRLRLFSLYVDYAASARARWAASAITKLAGSRWQSSTEMWSLGSLTAGESVRKMIASDAADADVLIIAATSLDQREPKLIEWLDSLAAWKSNRLTTGLLIGLFGDEETQSKQLEWTVQQFICCTRQMGRELVVQWMERDSMDDSDWLTQSVKALLARKQSACSETVLQEAAASVA